MSKPLIRFVTCLIIAGLLTMAGLPCAADNSVEVSPSALPAIDLTRLEPQVARQLESVQSLLLEVTSRRNATVAQRADAYGEFGRVLQAYGYAREAGVCYRHCCQLQPDEWRWWHLLGCADESSGSLTEAETSFRSAMKVGDYPATRVRLGNVLTQLNQREEAERLFADLLTANPKLAAAHAGAGTLALEGRDFKTAIHHLSRALELAPAANRLHYSLAMAYRGAGDPDLARQHLRLRGVVGLRPDDPLIDELPKLLKGTQVHLVRGKVALAAGAVSDAIREFRLSVEAAPDNISARVNLAVALVKSQAYAEAIPELEAALKQEPTNSAALFNLASLRQTGGDFSAAAILLQRLLQVEPRDSAARELLSQCLVELNQPVQAIDLLKEGLKLAPDDESSIVLLSEILAAQQHFADSIALLDAASTKHPERGLTSHALARRLASCPDAKLRDGDRALRLAKFVCDARPTFEHSETLAMALAATGRFEEAVRLQQQLLAAAEKRRADKVADRIRENLQRYERREIAR